MSNRCSGYASEFCSSPDNGPASITACRCSATRISSKDTSDLRWASLECIALAILEYRHPRCDDGIDMNTHPQSIVSHRKPSRCSGVI